MTAIQPYRERARPGNGSSPRPFPRGCARDPGKGTIPLPVT